MPTITSHTFELNSPNSPPHAWGTRTMWRILTMVRFFNDAPQRWTVVELVNFTCEWPNSQLDPPLVASLRRLVVNHSVISYVIRHGRKSVTLEIFISCKLLPSQTVNSRRSRPGRGSAVNRSQNITGQSEVGRKCITAVGLWLWFWGPSLCR